jgi:SHS2 domain-containing protein
MFESAEDLQSLLYTFLEEFIFMFGTEFFVAKKVKIIEFNKETPKIKAKLFVSPRRRPNPSDFLICIYLV